MGPKPLCCEQNCYPTRESFKNYEFSVQRLTNYSKNTDELLDVCRRVQMNVDEYRRMQPSHQTNVDECKRVTKRLQTSVDECRRVTRQVQKNVNKCRRITRQGQTNMRVWTSNQMVQAMQTNQKFDKVTRGPILLLLQVCKNRLHMFANFQFCSSICDYTQFFCKQSVYKQLALQ